MFAGLVEALEPDGPVEARWALEPPRFGERIGLLPGSFNPPTDAHRALAAAGHRAGLTSIAYLLSKRTVDKERVTGIPLADRLELLASIAREDGDGVAFANRGLYVELAAAMRPLVPRGTELVFLVGFDKIVQIFDPRYYEDREAALGELFARASFLVAPRAEADADDLDALLARRENRPYAARVRPLELDARYRDASSTAVRAGQQHEVPYVVAEYLRRERPFGD